MEVKSEPSAVLFLLVIAVLLQAAFCGSLSSCPKGLFSFGDSLADTGNYASAFPDPPQVPLQAEEIRGGPSTDVVFLSSKAVRLPFRSGNGRLVIDFVAQAFGYPFLSPYFQDIVPNYTQGANFAFSSSTARNTPLVVPFYLSRQVNHYNYFKGNAYNSRGESPTLPDFSIFSTGTHWISIGLNDFWQNYKMNNMTVGTVKSKVVPQVVSSVVDSVKRLYSYGARTFMVANVPALGCMPMFLSNFGTRNTADYDSLGCLKNHNDAAKTYANSLSSALELLRQQYGDANIMYGDYYRVHLDAVTNPTRYGLSSGGTLTACCGGGGQCSSSSQICSNPDAFISWDGLHFTEAFNRIVALTFLQGNYVEPWPSSNLSRVCSLDFSKFYS